MKTSRFSLLTAIAAVATFSLAGLSVSAPAAEGAGAAGGALPAAVVYFSLAENSAIETGPDGLSSASLVPGHGRTGAAAALAAAVGEAVGARAESIRTAKVYPSDFEAVVELNHEEAARDALPALIAAPDVSKARVVFIGYPSWSMTIPQAVASFIAKNDWQGKAIAVFNTNNGYGAGRGASAVASLAKGAVVLREVYAVRGSSAADAASQAGAAAWAKKSLDEAVKLLQ